MAELRSAHRGSPSSLPHGTRSRRMDRISSLSDDMLVLVLAHLRCVRSAVETSLLSRRWRGLWTRLPDLTFRGLNPTAIEASFSNLAAASPHPVSTLDIRLSSTHTATSANSLMRAAVRLSPGHLLFTLHDYYYYMGDIELPCFEETTSIQIDTGSFGVKPPPAGEFAALESLRITGRINDLRSMLTRCPCLRVLSISHRDMWFSPATLPPPSEFPALEKLSLSGKTVDLGALLNTSCKLLRELSITQRDMCLLHITLPPSGEFPVLEKLSLSGNIADIGTLLNGCPCLRVLGVTFRSMALGSIEAGLTTLEDMARLRGLMVSLIGVEIPWKDNIDAARLNSLLANVARLLPQEIIFTESYEGCNRFDQKVNADLPWFPRATSMSIWMSSLQSLCFTALPADEFLALKRLSVSGHNSIVDIGTLVTRCPCLQELNVTAAMPKITVHSVSLQKIAMSHNMDERTGCHRIDIVTPMLKQLLLNFHAATDIVMSISAPAVLHKVSWRSSYTPSMALLFGSWRLHIMSIQTIERSCYVDSRDDTCWQQPPQFYFLCLHLINAGNHLDGELNFAQEMEKLPVTNFSMVELYFKYERHVYGAFVLQFLRMHPIRAATKKLKVVLAWCGEEKGSCLRECPCHTPKNWRSQNFFYTSLEEVEIYAFNGEDHEYDFLRLIFRCSPMLKKLTMVLEKACRGDTAKLSNIFSAYPSVNWCYRYSNSSQMFQQCVSG